MYEWIKIGIVRYSITYDECEGKICIFSVYPPKEYHYTAQELIEYAKNSFGGYKKLYHLALQCFPKEVT